MENDIQPKQNIGRSILWLVVLAVIIVGGVVVSGQKAEIETIKIGVIAPLTGVRADAGEFTKNALAIAEEEINADAVRKFKTQFLFEDSRYEPAPAVSALRKLIDIDDVRYIIGPHGSSEVLAAAPVAEQQKVILIAPASQTSEVSQAGDYIFRLIHNSAQEAPVSAAFVAQRMKGGTLHFLALNTAITEAYLKDFTPPFEQAGKKIGLVEKFDSKAGDFKTELAKIKSKNPTDVFLIAAPKHAGLILKQANELGIKAQFYNIGVEGPDLLQLAGSAAEGLLYPYSYDVAGKSERVAHFYNAYAARFKGEPDTVAANVYDAAFLVSDCVEQVGDEVEKVKQCLYATKNFNGASGIFSVDENGDAVKNIFFKTVKGGKFVRVDETATTTKSSQQ